MDCYGRLNEIYFILSRTETPWDPTGGHRWSRAFPPMDHRWTIGGPPMPGTTSSHDHRWTTGGHRWKWKPQKQPILLKTLFSFVHIIQMVLPPRFDPMYSRVWTMRSFMSTHFSKVKTTLLKTINKIQMRQNFFTVSNNRNTFHIKYTKIFFDRLELCIFDVLGHQIQRFNLRLKAHQKICIYSPKILGRIGSLKLIFRR